MGGTSDKLNSIGGAIEWCWRFDVSVCAFRHVCCAFLEGHMRFVNDKVVLDTQMNCNQLQDAKPPSEITCSMIRGGNVRHPSVVIDRDVKSWMVGLKIIACGFGERSRDGKSSNDRQIQSHPLAEDHWNVLT